MADTIEMQGDGWEASVLLHCTDDLTHVTIEVWGDDALPVVAGLRLVYELLSMKRLTFLRAPAEVEEVKDFESALKTYRGYARFSFKYEAGETHHPLQSTETFLGLAKGDTDA